MTLRDLEIFVTVAETGSMKKAAEEMYISQPSVSGVIAHLEKNYNVLLFERLNKRLYITDMGQKLLTYARRMLSLRDEIEMCLNDADDTTPVRIGATVTIGTSIIPRAVNKLKKEDINVYVKIDDTATIEECILNNTLDIGFVEGRINNRDIKKIPFMKDEMMFICKDSREFYHKESITLKEVLNYPLILREKNSGTRIVIDEVMEQAEYVPDVIWDCNNTQTILSGIKSGLGVSVLSPRLIENIKGLKAIPISDFEITRDFLMIIHKDKILGEKMKKLMEIVSEDSVKNKFFTRNFVPAVQSSTLF